MLLGLGGREGCVMPCLVHRITRVSGVLGGATECITQLFWAPLWEQIV